jgi:ribulose-5-phosphate 4-epimerase/fuculose-1-phosphate aldolase
MTVPVPTLDRNELLHDVTDEEWELRVHTAAAFRLGYHFNWNRVVSNHISARIPGYPDRFLMNPYGLGWNEITASSLVTADFDGNLLSHRGVSLAPAGFNFHSGILKARPDINAIIHTHTMAGVVLSAIEPEVMIVSQSACHMYGEIGYHDFEGFADEADEVPRMIEDLGDKHTLIMWNHGLLSVGGSIPEAFFYMRRLIEVCEIQERVHATGQKVRHIPRKVLEFTRRQLAERRRNRPYSEVEWASYLRLAESLDPSFAR